MRRALPLIALFLQKQKPAPEGTGFAPRHRSDVGGRDGERNRTSPQERWVPRPHSACTSVLALTSAVPPLVRPIYTLALTLAILTGCASTGVPSGPQPPRMAVTVQNDYRDPVDVTVYCGHARVAKVKWLMRQSSETVRVRAGRACDFRFTIEASISGGPYSYSPTYDSYRGYESMGTEARVCVSVGNLVTNSSALQGPCR